MKKISRRTFFKTTGKFALGAAACGAAGFMMPPVARGSVPTIRMAYILSDHHAPLIVAAKHGDLFQERFNIFLKPVIEGRRYELHVDGARAAAVQLIPTKKGPDVEKLMAQGSIDMGISGTQAILMSVDRGIDVRLVSPVQTAGNVFVVHKDQPIDSWEGFVDTVKQKDRPFSIGIPGPDTVASIIFSGALAHEGISFTEDLSNRDADIRFINMKGHGNLVAALNNRIADGIIGAQPFPAVTIDQGVGRFILNLQDMPPGGWHDHACCSVEAGAAFIKQDPELVTQMLMLLTLGAEVCQTRKDLAALACSEWLGIPVGVEEVAMQSLRYTTVAGDSWRKSVAAYARVMENMGLFDGALNGVQAPVLADRTFDFRHSEKARQRLQAQGLVA